MTRTSVIGVVVNVVLATALAVVVLAAASCASRQSADSGGVAAPAPADAPAQTEQKPSEPEYTSWQVYVNGDDSFTKGGITYSIALNLKATNPTGDIAGTYKGTATAKTDSSGEYQGRQLNASAIAKSSKLVFKLEDDSGTAENPLAPLTAEDRSLSGSGSIVMKASGGGTYGAAGGSFSNTSGQNLKVDVNGSDVTLKVDIQGHTYTFKGTISGK